MVSAEEILLMGGALGGMVGVLGGYVFGNPVLWARMKRMFLGKNNGFYFNFEKGGFLSKKNVVYTDDKEKGKLGVKVNGEVRYIPHDRVARWSGIPVAFGNEDLKAALPFDENQPLDVGQFGICMEKEAELAQIKERLRGKKIEFYLLCFSLVLACIIIFLVLMVNNNVQNTPVITASILNHTATKVV